MKNFVSASLLAFILIGCGGSSEPQIDNSAKLRGVAVDDLIVHGLVKVYPAYNNKKILVEGLSDDDGTYSVNVPYNGVVVVEVICDPAGSWMYNPVTKEKKECISGLKLHSAAVVESKKEVEVNISPITELVVAQMLENGVSEDELIEAQNNIGTMIGFDPLSESPVKNDQYVKVIDSIHKMAEKDDSKTLVDIVKSLSEDYKDGKAGDSLDNNISKEFAKAMKNSGVNNFLVINDGLLDPKEVNSSKSDIEISKEFFDSLRAQAMSLVDYKNSGTPGFFDKEAKNLGEVLENITMDVNLASKYTTGIILDVVNLIDNNQTQGQRELGNSKVITYTKSDDVWKYSIKEYDKEKYSGELEFSTNKLTLKEFTSIKAKFEGTLPLEGDNVYESINRDKRTLSRQSQEVKIDVLMSKKDYGADLLLTNLYLSSEEASLKLDDLKIQAYYSFNNKDELLMNHIKFNEATISGDAGTYNITGKLEVTQYIKNDSIKDKNFNEDVYKTNVYGSVLCLDEHNQRINSLSNTIVTYRDKSGITHNLEVNEHGNFWSKIDGNVENLDPNDYYVASVSVGNEDYSDYVGLEFKEFEINSNSCDDIKIEYFHTDDGQNSTNISLRAFCVQDGHRVELEDASIKFTDSSQEYELNKDADFFDVNIDKNLQELGILSLQRDYTAAGFINHVDQDNIEVTTDSCTNPIITYFDFSLDSDENFYNSGIIPKKLNFSGDIKNSANGSYIKSKIDFDLINAKTIDLLNDDRPIVKVDLVGKIKMSEQPEMLLSLVYNNQNLKTVISFAYMYESTIINGLGTFDKDILNGDIVLSSPQGLRLNAKVVEGNLAYDSNSKLTRNGKLVGMLEERESVPVIKYTDGTFESLP